MNHGERRCATRHRLRRFVLAVFMATGIPGAQAMADATSECLVSFGDVPDAQKSGGTIQCTDCDPSCDADGVNLPNGSCTFTVKACVNQADGTCTATELKKVTVKGKCGPSALTPVSSGAAPVCSEDTNVSVKLSKHGRKRGRCKLVAKAVSSSKPRRIDKDVLMLICNPRPAGEACPASGPTTTTTLPENVVCEPLVNDGQGIPGTYRLLSVQGPKICQTNAPQNRFGPCTTDADCGGGAGNCATTPWASADGVVLPFPTGIATALTISAEDPPPHCNHTACIPCGNEAAACAGLPACGAPPAAPNPGCIKNTCCDQPGFTIPTFLVPLLGGLCSRLDMYRCGFGVVNSSNPQVGDNEVTKTGDTSDPGPDCEYGTADDPPAKPCNTLDAPPGAGHDLKGKVSRRVGNNAFDMNGIQYRASVPSLSTTWQDGQSPSGTCAPGSIFDGNELIITQLVLNAEFSTAGATGSFADLNGDGCARAGAGFSNANKNGPFTLGSPPAAPQPYDGHTDALGVASTAVSAGIALSGGGPLYDIGFIAVLTNGPITRLPTASCSCTQTPGCPE